MYLKLVLGLNIASIVEAKANSLSLFVMMLEKKSESPALDDCDIQLFQESTILN
jgi:hypothetical protein